MNKVIEENFVNSYIMKNKRERLLFELWGKSAVMELVGFRTVLTIL